MAVLHHGWQPLIQKMDGPNNVMQQEKTFSNFYTLFSKFQFFCQDVMKCEIFCQFTLKLAFRSNVGVQGSKCLTQKKEQPNIDKNIFYFQMIQQQNKVLDEQFLMHYACSNMLVSDLGKSPLHFACTLQHTSSLLWQFAFSQKLLYLISKHNGKLRRGSSEARTESIWLAMKDKLKLLNYR